MSDRGFDQGRREFIRNGLIAGAVVATGGGAIAGVDWFAEKTGIKHDLATWWELSGLSPQQRTEKYGLTRYEGTRKRLDWFYNTFQAAPGFGTMVRNVSGVLNGVRNANLRYIEKDVAALGNRIGTLRDNATEEALNKLATLTIKTSDEEDPEEVRKSLLRFARVFPASFIELENTITTTRGGGNAAFGHFSVGTPTNPDNTVAWVHELGHRMQDNPFKMAPYLSPDRLAEYWETFCNQTKLAVEAYLSLPWDQARTFKHGDHLIGLSDDDINARMKIYYSQSQELKNLLPEWEGMPSSLPEDTEARNKIVREAYNHMIHLYGRALLEIGPKPKSELTPAEEKVRYAFGVSSLKLGLVGEFAHYFIGPAQRNGGGLPKNEEEISDHSSVLSRANLAIQKARLRTFSTLSDTSVSGLFQALGKSTES